MILSENTFLLDIETNKYIMLECAMEVKCIDPKEKIGKMEENTEEAWWLNIHLD